MKMFPGKLSVLWAEPKAILHVVLPPWTHGLGRELPTPRAKHLNHFARHGERHAMRGEALMADIVKETYGTRGTRSKLPARCRGGMRFGLFRCYLSCAPARGKLIAKGSSKTYCRTIFTKIEPNTEDGFLGQDGRIIFTIPPFSITGRSKIFLN
eukprot:3795044-Amphidinium_carterae.1